MQGLIKLLNARKIPQWLAVTVAFSVFIGSFFLILLVIFPLAWQQTANLINELPRMIAEGQQLLLVLPQRYPEIFSDELIQETVAVAKSELGMLGQKVLTFSLASIPNLVGLMIYIVLVPILVFFFLKDGGLIMRWLATFLPAERPILDRVWHEMNDQVANYIRGKAVEILIVAGVSYIAFATLGLNYAALLALLVGLSVLIPYIGAAVVTLPIALIGYYQWGWTSEFFTLLGVYAVIQALDGNVLVPLLFSETVNLHPVAIILAVLVFGGLWGFWGVFFAIPLATLTKAVLNAWPRHEMVE
jgi:putative permease